MKRHGWFSSMRRQQQACPNVVSRGVQTTVSVPQSSLPSDIEKDDAMSIIAMEPISIESSKEKEHENILLQLPFDALSCIAMFLTPRDVDGMRLISKKLSHLCKADPIWREFCIQTGKIDENDTLQDHAHDSYHQIYTNISCVPVDFPTINQALHFLQLKNAKEPSKIVITLMPGVYHQRIDLVANQVQDDTTMDESSSSSSSCLSTDIQSTEIQIRAAFPDQGAALVFHDRNRNESSTDMSSSRVDFPNQSCINLFGLDSPLSTPRNTMLLHLMNLQILHSTMGTDIWNGNSAINVYGSNMTLSLDRCTLQSDSGRGIVIMRGATLFMKDTVIHDCAATGLYIGDAGSNGIIRRCNIVRNGNGSRRPPTVMQTRRGGRLGIDPPNVNADDRDDGADADALVHLHNFQDNVFFDVVPPGHSGMYVETGTAIIEDTLVASNSLTGISVVRGGLIRIGDCDITHNGTLPIETEDVHDLHNLGMMGAEFSTIRGGIMEIGGNKFEGMCYRKAMRPTPFFRIVEEAVTIQRLQQCYQAER